jgi:hypothetical protein
MKNQVSLGVGVVTAGLAVVWLISQPTDSGFFGDFVRPTILTLADLLFRSPEAAFFLAFPVVILYGVLFGLAAGLMCRLLLSVVLRSGRPKAGSNK